MPKLVVHRDEEGHITFSNDIFPQALDFYSVFCDDCYIGFLEKTETAVHVELKATCQVNWFIDLHLQELILHTRGVLSIDATLHVSEDSDIKAHAIFWDGVARLSGVPRVEVAAGLTVYGDVLCKSADISRCGYVKAKNFFMEEEARIEWSRCFIEVDNAVLKSGILSLYETGWHGESIFNKAATVRGSEQQWKLSHHLFCAKSGVLHLEQATIMVSDYVQTHGTVTLLATEVTSPRLTCADGLHTFKRVKFFVKTRVITEDSASFLLSDVVIAGAVIQKEKEAVEYVSAPEITLRGKVIACKRLVLRADALRLALQGDALTRINAVAKEFYLHGGVSAATCSRFIKAYFKAETFWTDGHVHCDRSFWQDTENKTSSHTFDGVIQMSASQCIFAGQMYQYSESHVGFLNNAYLKSPVFMMHGGVSLNSGAVLEGEHLFHESTEDLFLLHNARATVTGYASTTRASFIGASFAAESFRVAGPLTVMSSKKYGSQVQVKKLLNVTEAASVNARLGTHLAAPEAVVSGKVTLDHARLETRDFSLMPKATLKATAAEILHKPDQKPEDTAASKTPAPAEITAVFRVFSGASATLEESRLTTEDLTQYSQLTAVSSELVMEGTTSLGFDSSTQLEASGLETTSLSAQGALTAKSKKIKNKKGEEETHGARINVKEDATFGLASKVTGDKLAVEAKHLTTLHEIAVDDLRLTGDDWLNEGSVHTTKNLFVGMNDRFTNERGTVSGFNMTFHASVYNYGGLIKASGMYSQAGLVHMNLGCIAATQSNTNSLVSVNGLLLPNIPNSFEEAIALYGSWSYLIGAITTAMSIAFPLHAVAVGAASAIVGLGMSLKSLYESLPKEKGSYFPSWSAFKELPRYEQIALLMQAKSAIVQTANACSKFREVKDHYRKKDKEGKTNYQKQKEAKKDRNESKGKIDAWRKDPATSKEKIKEYDDAQRVAKRWQMAQHAWSFASPFVGNHADSSVLSANFATFSVSSSRSGVAYWNIGVDAALGGMVNTNTLLGNTGVMASTSLVLQNNRVLNAGLMYGMRTSLDVGTFTERGTSYFDQVTGRIGNLQQHGDMHFSRGQVHVNRWFEAASAHTGLRDVSLDVDRMLRAGEVEAAGRVQLAVGEYTEGSTARIIAGEKREQELTTLRVKKALALAGSADLRRGDFSIENDGNGVLSAEQLLHAERGVLRRYHCSEQKVVRLSHLTNKVTITYPVDDASPMYVMSKSHLEWDHAQKRMHALGLHSTEGNVAYLQAVSGPRITGYAEKGNLYVTNELKAKHIVLEANGDIDNLGGDIHAEEHGEVRGARVRNITANAKVATEETHAYAIGKQGRMRAFGPDSLVVVARESHIENHGGEIFGERTHLDAKGDVLNFANVRKEKGITYYDPGVISGGKGKHHGDIGLFIKAEHIQGVASDFVATGHVVLNAKSVNGISLKPLYDIRSQDPVKQASFMKGAQTQEQQILNIRGCHVGSKEGKNFLITENGCTTAQAAIFTSAQGTEFIGATPAVFQPLEYTLETRKWQSAGATNWRPSQVVGKQTYCFNSIISDPKVATSPETINAVTPGSMITATQGGDIDLRHVLFTGGGDVFLRTDSQSKVLLSAAKIQARADYESNGVSAQVGAPGLAHAFSCAVQGDWHGALRAVDPLSSRAHALVDAYSAEDNYQKLFSSVSFVTEGFNTLAAGMRALSDGTLGQACLERFDLGDEKGLNPRLGINAHMDRSTCHGTQLLQASGIHGRGDIHIKAGVVALYNGAQVSHTGDVFFDGVRELILTDTTTEMSRSVTDVSLGAETKLSPDCLTGKVNVDTHDNFAARRCMAVWAAGGNFHAGELDSLVLQGSKIQARSMSGHVKQADITSVLSFSDQQGVKADIRLSVLPQLAAGGGGGEARLLQGIAGIYLQDDVNQQGSTTLSFGDVTLHGGKITTNGRMHFVAKSVNGVSMEEYARHTGGGVNVSLGTLWNAVRSPYDVLCGNPVRELPIDVQWRRYHATQHAVIAGEQGATLDVQQRTGFIHTQDTNGKVVHKDQSRRWHVDVPVTTSARLAQATADIHKGARQLLLMMTPQEHASAVAAYAQPVALVAASVNAVPVPQYLSAVASSETTSAATKMRALQLLVTMQVLYAQGQQHPGKFHSAPFKLQALGFTHNRYGQVQLCDKGNRQFNSLKTVVRKTTKPNVEKLKNEIVFWKTDAKKGTGKPYAAVKYDADKKQLVGEAEIGKQYRKTLGAQSVEGCLGEATISADVCGAEAVARAKATADTSGLSVDVYASAGIMGPSASLEYKSPYLRALCLRAKLAYEASAGVGMGGAAGFNASANSKGFNMALLLAAYPFFGFKKVFKFEEFGFDPALFEYSSKAFQDRLATDSLFAEAWKEKAEGVHYGPLHEYFDEILDADTTVAFAQVTAEGLKEMVTLIYNGAASVCEFAGEQMKGIFESEVRMTQATFQCLNQRR